MFTVGFRILYFSLLNFSCLTDGASCFCLDLHDLTLFSVTQLMLQRSIISLHLVVTLVVKLCVHASFSYLSLFCQAANTTLFLITCLLEYIINKIKLQ